MGKPCKEGATPGIERRQQSRMQRKKRGPNGHATDAKRAGRLLHSTQVPQGQSKGHKPKGETGCKEPMPNGVRGGSQNPGTTPITRGTMPTKHTQVLGAQKRKGKGNRRQAHTDRASGVLPRVLPNQQAKNGNEPLLDRRSAVKVVDKGVSDRRVDLGGGRRAASEDVRVPVADGMDGMDIV